MAKGKDNLIIISDWKAIVGEGVDEQAVGFFGLGMRNYRGERLADYCKQNDMIIVNKFQNIHQRWRYTYYIEKFQETLQNTNSTILYW